MVDWRQNEFLALLQAGTTAWLGGTDAPSGLNRLVSWATNGTGTVDLALGGARFQLPPLPYHLANASVEINAIRVEGLDQWKHFEPIVPALNAPGELLSNLSLGPLNLSVELALHLDRAAGGRSVSSPALPLSISARFGGLAVVAAATLLLNGTGLAALQLRQAFGRGCIGTQLPTAALTQLGAAGELLALGAAGGGGSHADTRIGGGGGGSWQLTLPAPVRAFLLSRANGWLEDHVHPHGGGCTPPTHPSAEIVDVRKSAALASARAWLARRGAAGVDDAARWLSKRRGWAPGELRLPGPVFGVSLADATFGRLALEVSELRVLGADRVWSLDALNASGGPRALEHAIGVGGGGVPLSLAAAVRMRAGGGDTEQFWLRLRLRQALLRLGTTVALDLNSGGSYTLGQLWRRPTCAAASLRHIRLEAAASSASEPFAERAAVALELRRAGGTQSGGGEYGSGEGSDDHDGAAAIDAARLFELLGHVQRGSFSVLNERMNRTLLWLQHSCGDPGENSSLPPRRTFPPSVPSPAPASLGPIAAALSAAAFLALLALLALSWWSRRVRRQRLLRLLDEELLAGGGGGSGGAPHSAKPHNSPRSAERAAAEHSGGASLVAAAAAWNPEADTLCSYPGFRSPLLRAGVPLLLLGNALLFLVANVSVGARIELSLDLAGAPLAPLPPLFEFTLLGTVRDTWAAGAYVLSIAIGLLSGIWPYVKLVLLYGAWRAPGTTLAAAGGRERMLRILDALGKWSLLDFLMFAQLSAAFRLEIALPSSDGLNASNLNASSLNVSSLNGATGILLHAPPGGDARPPQRHLLPLMGVVRSEVVAGVGTLYFLAAALLSLAAAHLLLALQRAASDGARSGARAIEEVRLEVTRGGGRGGRGRGGGTAAAAACSDDGRWPRLAPLVATTRERVVAETTAAAGDAASIADGGVPDGSAAASAMSASAPAAFHPPLAAMHGWAAERSQPSANDATAVLTLRHEGLALLVGRARQAAGPLTATAAPSQALPPPTRLRELLARRAPLGVPLALTAGGAFMLAAVYAEAFSLQVLGLTGFMLSHQGVTREVSLASLAVELGPSSVGGDDLGTDGAARTLQAIFVVICIAVPLLWLGLLALLWSAPLAQSRRRQLMVAAEVAYAWSALDVFLLTTVASIFELDRFAHFLISSHCGGAIDDFLAKYFSELDPQGEGCFGVAPTLGPGIWLMLGAALCGLGAGSIIMAACHATLGGLGIQQGR